MARADERDDLFDKIRLLRIVKIERWAGMFDHSLHVPPGPVAQTRQDRPLHPLTIRFARGEGLHLGSAKIKKVTRNSCKGIEFICSIEFPDRKRELQAGRSRRGQQEIWRHLQDNLAES